MINNNIQKSNIKNSYFFIFFLFFFFLINFTRLYSGTYNLEWYFIELSKYFNNDNYFFDIFLFKQNQANTTFYSLILSLFNFLAPTYEAKTVLFRFINFIPLIVLFFFIYTKNKINYEKNTQILLLIMFCPIVTVYSFRIYPDFLSATLTWISLIALINKNTNISIITFVLSFLIKPVSIIVFPIFILFFFKKFKENRIKLIFKYAFFTIITYIIYFLYNEKIIFGSYYESTYLKLDLLGALSNFFRYYNYIVLLCMPIISYPIVNYLKNENFTFKKLYKLLTLTTLLTAAYSIYFYNNGEMNYGYIDKLIKNQYLLYLINFISILAGIVFFIIFIKNKKYKMLFLTFLGCLLFLSILITRPTQRYLIYLLPILFFLIIELYKDKQKYIKISLILYILLFSIISYGQKLVQQKTLDSTDVIMTYLTEKKLIEDTHPGQIYHSRGYLFEKYLLNEIKLKNQLSYYYQITDCKNDSNHMIMKKISIYNINIKKLCLIKINQ